MLRTRYFLTVEVPSPSRRIESLRILEHINIVRISSLGASRNNERFVGAARNNGKTIRYNCRLFYVRGKARTLVPTSTFDDEIIDSRREQPSDVTGRVYMFGVSATMIDCSKRVTVLIGTVEYDKTNRFTAKTVQHFDRKMTPSGRMKASDRCSELWKIHN